MLHVNRGLVASLTGSLVAAVVLLVGLVRQAVGIMLVNSFPVRSQLR